jgi:SpoVK/Ycf46/Vps4 family AAA+-type ATPase
MYSFIDDGETLANYYDAFMKSSANILILIGPPGTGKTSFIRGFLHHTESSAMVTYDEQVVSTDTLFTEFLDDSSNVLVLEDADTFLRPRSDGNNMISRFLNIGDGLPSVRGKKLIFSTNLPSIKEIDPALLRPGRTFDVLHFSGLTAEKATKLAKKFDIDFVPTEGRTEDYTVSEIFTGLKVNAGPVKRKFGFC